MTDMTDTLRLQTPSGALVFICAVCRETMRAPDPDVEMFAEVIRLHTISCGLSKRKARKLAQRWGDLLTLIAIEQHESEER